MKAEGCRMSFFRLHPSALRLATLTIAQSSVVVSFLSRGSASCRLDDKAMTVDQDLVAMHDDIATVAVGDNGNVIALYVD
jgi:hypothetical protein